MAMLKTIGQGHNRAADGFYRIQGEGPDDDGTGGSGHTGSVRDLDDYLYLGPKAERGRVRHMEAYLEYGHGHEHRPLAFGKTDELRFQGEHGWSDEMDETRKAWGKDEGRTYYHFAISADPADHVGAEELRDVALEWVREALPGTQAAVSVHDDNEGHIMHAHVVVNSVYPDTGRKIHRSRRDVDREADLCQDICREHGLGYLPYLRDVRRQVREGRRVIGTSQWSRMSAAERSMRRRGAHSWMADIRDAVDACVPKSTTWAAFERNMSAMGYQIRRPRRGGITFVHPTSTGHDRRARGERMGTDYCEEGILARLGTDFDGTLGLGMEPQSELDGRIAMSRARRATRRERERQARHHGVTPRRAPGPLTLEEAAMRRVPIRGRGESLRGVEGALRAMATLRRGGFESIPQVDRALRDASGRLAAIEAHAAAIGDGMRRASELLEVSRSVDAARREVEALPTGIWRVATRLRSNELRRQIAEGSERVRQGLGTAHEFVRAEGLRYYPDTYVLERLVGEYHEQAQALKRDADRIAHEMGDLQCAMDALGPRRKQRTAEGQMPLRLATKARIPRSPSPDGGRAPHGGEAIAASMERRLDALIAARERQRSTSIPQPTKAMAHRPVASRGRGPRL